MEKPFFKNLNLLSKLFFSISGVIYALGFLVVSIYLSQFQVSPLNLIRYEYLLAGFWLTIPLIVALYCCSLLSTAFYDRLVDQREREKVEWGFLKWAWNISFALFLIYGWILITTSTLSWSIPHIYQEFNKLNFLDILILVVLSFALGFTGTMSVLFWKFIEFSIKKENLGTIIWATFTTFAFILGMIIYIGYFSLNLYPKIPSVLGGGGPKEVRFTLSNSSTESFIKEALDYDEENGVTATQYLISSNDTFFLIYDEKKNIVFELPRKNVSMVSYSPITDSLEIAE